MGKELRQIWAQIQPLLPEHNRLIPMPQFPPCRGAATPFLTGLLSGSVIEDTSGSGLGALFFLVLCFLCVKARVSPPPWFRES